MTVTDNRRRPSPRPRPATEQPVTERGSEICNAGQPKMPAERETAPADTKTLQPAITLRDRLVGSLATARTYWVPPNLLTQPPASLAELSDYAHWASWTSNTTGPIRALGVAWHRGVGIPVTAACRYVEWIAQRPGRAVPVFGVWKLFILTGPGPAIADNVIRPCLGFVAWVLL